MTPDYNERERNEREKARRKLRQEATERAKQADIERLAEKIFLQLMGNSSRYDYISELVGTGKITQEEANLKNVSKAFKMAKTFIEYREGLNKK
jgi:hypothetical protein